MRLRRRPKLPLRLALLVVLVSLAIRALVSEPTLTFALDELARRLHEELGLTLVVAHVQADAENAQVEMGPVVLKGTDGEVLFTAEKIRAELAPLKFFEKRLRLEHLVIESPRVSLRIVDGKIAGIAPPADAAPSGDPLLKVDVADFQLHDGAVSIDVVGENKRIVASNLSGIEMRLRDRGREEHRLKFTVQQADVKRPLDDGGEDIVTIDAFSGRIAVKGDGLLAPEKVTVSDVTLVADDAELNIAGDVIIPSGGSASSGRAGLVPAFEADISARAELASVLTHLQLGMPITGGATLTAHVSAQPGGEQLTAVGQIETRDVHVDNLHMGSLRARIKATPAQIDVEQAAWDWADTTIQGAATVQLDEKLHTTVKAHADGFSIWKLMWGMGVDGAWGDATVDGAVEVAGTLDPLLLEGKGGGTFTDVVAASMDVRKALAAHPDRIVLRTVAPIVAQEVSIRVNDEGIKFEGGVDDGFTRAHGFFQVFYDVNKGLLIDAESEQADFATVGGKIGDLNFAGVGRGHMHVEGPQSGPVLTAELELNGFALEEFAFGDAAGRVHLFGDDLRFEDVVAVKNGRTKYGGLVALSFADPPPRSELEKPDATIESPHLTVDVGFGSSSGAGALAEDLRAIVPSKYVDGVLGFLREDLELTGPVRGRVAARGAVGDGTFDHIEMEGKVDLLEGAAVFDQRLSGDGTFHMTVDRFYIDSLDVALGSADKRSPTVTAARGVGHAVADVGRHDADLAGSFSVHGLQLADIDELKDASRPFKGAVDFEGRLHGIARNPKITGRASVRGAAFGSIPIGDADVDVGHDNRLLTLVGKALSGRGDAIVHVTTRSPFSYDANVTISEGQLAPLLPPDVLPGSVSAVVAGNVEVRGALKTFRDSRGALALKKLAVKASGLDLTSVGEASAHFHGTRLTFDLLDLTTRDKDVVSLRGLLSDDELDLQLSGHADLKVLPSLWTKATSADGKLTFDLAVTGDLDHAAMSGQGFIAGGKLQLDGPFPPLEDLDAQIAFRGPNIVIERATAKAGGAAIQGQGAVTMDGLDPLAYDLELRYQRMKLKAPANIESVSSGRLALKGEAALPTLTGEVRIHSARYAEDINWERLLPDLRRRSGALESLDTDDEDVRFDVHLIADRGVVVENNVLDLEAKGDLFLTGTEERPGLKGGVQLIRGNATFRGNRYRLTAGTVDFVDTYRVMPVLDIEAETRVQDYDVTAHLTGPAQAPQIDLSSRPDLSEIDIVSLLTFGFTQYEVRDAGGSAGAAGLEVVSAYTGLDKELRRVLPEAVRKSSALSLDELRLTSQFSVRAGASVPAVALGMEVNPGLWGVDGSRLRLQSTLLDTTGSGTQQRVEWEKRFDNNVRLRVVWDSEDDGTCPSCTNQWGDLGGDLWYRWEF